MLSGQCWPAHPHPYRDELLTSWLVRIAHANGVKAQTFCDRVFGAHHQIWNRDMDRLAPEWLLAQMAKGSGCSMSRVKSTTLTGFEQVLFHANHASGQLRWILPLSIYHRKHRGFGLQCCPLCLAEDDEPYFRRAWRLALFTYCPKHQTMLLDRCPECDSTIEFHRIELGRPQQIDVDSLATCWQCGFDLRKATVEPVEKWDRMVFATWERALRFLARGWRCKSRFDYSRLDVLHQLCAIIVSMRLAPKLQGYICSLAHLSIHPLLRNRISFEQRCLAERHYVLGLAWWLMMVWPKRLIRAWKAKAVKYNVLLKDFDQAPEPFKKLLSSLNRRRKAHINTTAN